MMKTTEIEEQLKRRCINELEKIAENFMQEAEKLEKQNNIERTLYWCIQDYRREKVTHTAMRNEQMKSVILDALKDRYLEDMLKHKTKELLNKLELL